MSESKYSARVALEKRLKPIVEALKKRKVRIDEHKYIHLFEKCGGKCCIEGCKVSVPSLEEQSSPLTREEKADWMSAKRLSLDYCRDTGEPRGFVCAVHEKMIRWYEEHGLITTDLSAVAEFVESNRERIAEVIARRKKAAKATARYLKRSKTDSAK